MDLKYLLLFSLLAIAVWGIFYDRSHTEGAHTDPVYTEVPAVVSKPWTPPMPPVALAPPGLPPARVEPAPTPTPAESAATPAPATSELVKRCSSSLLIVEGDEGRGSASVINVKGHPLIVTNIHVVSGNTHTTFRLLNGHEVTPETLGVPEDRDLMVATQRQVTGGLEMSTAVDQEVSIGDEVLVLGNSQGGNVVTEISGKIMGIGPDLIETDAKFVEGNSGSPIIHVKTGKVIALATFALIRRITKLTQDSNFDEVRRFGYRIDTVPQWRFLTPQAFSVESAQVAEIKQRTSELLMLAKELMKNRHDTPSHYKQGGWVRHYVDRIGDGTRGRGTGVYWEPYQPVVDEFNRTLNGDFQQIVVNKLIPYHQKEIAQEWEMREVLTDFFRAVNWDVVRYQ